MQKRGLSRSRRPHQRDKLAFPDIDADILERDYMERVAHKLLGQVACFDNGIAHVFWRPLSPSLRPDGGFTIRSSPPINPWSIRTPCALAGPVLTVRRTALPSRITNTAPSRTADAGTITTRFATQQRASGFSPETNATL